MINNWLDGLPSDQKGLRQKLIQMRNIATGSAGLSTPTPTGITPEGAPVTAPRDVYNYCNCRRWIAGWPGAGRDRAYAESAAGRAANLQATASTSPQYHADLENLRTDSAVMGNLGGPTQDVEKKLNQLSTRLAGFGITMSPDQLRASESPSTRSPATLRSIRRRCWAVRTPPAACRSGQPRTAACPDMDVTA